MCLFSDLGCDTENGFAAAVCTIMIFLHEREHEQCVRAMVAPAIIAAISDDIG